VPKVRILTETLQAPCPEAGASAFPVECATCEIKGYQTLMVRLGSKRKFLVFAV
jgi:hypothetical protein